MAGGRHHPSRSAQTRLRIAQEAARIMVEQGLRDYHAAKRKAAERLRLGDPRDFPANEEVERAVIEYQRLFRADRQPGELRALRRKAIEAMRFLEPFRPRLVGPVLQGTADALSEVCLHLFAEPAEAVSWFLMDRGVRYEISERRLRFGGDAEHCRVPAFRVSLDGVPIELVVFSGRLRRRPPLSPVDGRPMARAGLREVEALVEDPGRLGA